MGSSFLGSMGSAAAGMVCCSLLQSVAVCCGLLQCVAVLSSFLQRDAVRRSVSQCVFKCPAA